ncbi:hypothetical protein GCM10023350_29040 [Nocardioides endophyticus]|uniref:Major facilitator superfamily (MFS) profile domain-containing protein n=1 Tax=Nocardioides endophyticus TaxID=1353775 RepID=A0ABP8YYV5_9ACTN
MLALAWSVYFAFALTVASLAPIVGTVRTDLALSYAQVGVVLGAWQLTYLVAALPVGYLVDRFDVRWAIFAGTLLVPSTSRHCWAPSPSSGSVVWSCPWGCRRWSRSSSPVVPARLRPAST